MMTKLKIFFKWMVCLYTGGCKTPEDSYLICGSVRLYGATPITAICPKCGSNIKGLCKIDPELRDKELEREFNG